MRKESVAKRSASLQSIPRLLSLTNVSSCEALVCAICKLVSPLGDPFKYTLNLSSSVSEQVPRWNQNEVEGRSGGEEPCASWRVSGTELHVQVENTLNGSRFQT